MSVLQHLFRRGPWPTADYDAIGRDGLKAVFKEISRQTSKTVIYNDDLLKFDGKVRADFIDVDSKRC